MLEKILEEIENNIFGVNGAKKNPMIMQGDEGYVPVHWILEIIRKHMNDGKGKEYISRQDAIDVIMQTYRYESDRMTALQELPIIRMNDG